MLIVTLLTVWAKDECYYGSLEEKKKSLSVRDTFDIQEETFAQVGTFEL